MRDVKTDNWIIILI